MKEQPVFQFSQAVYGSDGELLGFVGYTREKRYVACVPDADVGLRSVELVQDGNASTLVVPTRSRDKTPPSNLSGGEVERWRRFDRHHTFAGVNFRQAVAWLRELVDAKTLDPAIVRSGRIDHVIRVGLPEAAQTVELLRAYQAIYGVTLPDEAEVDTVGLPPAAIKELVQSCSEQGAGAYPRELVRAKFHADLSSEENVESFLENKKGDDPKPKHPARS